MHDSLLIRDYGHAWSGLLISAIPVVLTAPFTVDRTCQYPNRVVQLGASIMVKTVIRRRRVS